MEVQRKEGACKTDNNPGTCLAPTQGRSWSGTAQSEHTPRGSGQVAHKKSTGCSLPAQLLRTLAPGGSRHSMVTREGGRVILTEILKKSRPTPATHLRGGGSTGRGRGPGWAAHPASENTRGALEWLRSAHHRTWIIQSGLLLPATIATLATSSHPPDKKIHNGRQQETRAEPMNSSTVSPQAPPPQPHRSLPPCHNRNLCAAMAPSPTQQSCGHERLSGLLTGHHGTAMVGEAEQEHRPQSQQGQDHVGHISI